MNKKSLGMIETWGYVAAIEALDAGLKAANVTCLGYSITPSALVSIRLVGDVAAVTAAVKAGFVAASKVGQVVSCHVIPRPDDQLGGIIEHTPQGDPPLIPPGFDPTVDPTMSKDKGRDLPKTKGSVSTKTTPAKKGRSTPIRKTDGKPAKPSAVIPQKPVKARKKKKRKAGTGKPKP